MNNKKEYKYECQGCNRYMVMSYSSLEFAMKIKFKCTCGKYYNFKSEFKL